MAQACSAAAVLAALSNICAAAVVLFATGKGSLQSITMEHKSQPSYAPPEPKAHNVQLQCSCRYLTLDCRVAAAVAAADLRAHPTPKPHPYNTLHLLIRRLLTCNGAASVR
jgi:hypothetical protein